MLHDELDVGAVELTAQRAAHVCDARNESTGAATATAADVVRGELSCAAVQQQQQQQHV